MYDLYISFVHQSATHLAIGSWRLVVDMGGSHNFQNETHYWVHYRLLCSLSVVIFVAMARWMQAYIIFHQHQEVCQYILAI